MHHNGLRSAPQDSSTKPFLVRTGLIEYVVLACDRDSAIQAFRERLCRELPRLWDVIQGLGDEQFSVAANHGDNEVA